MPLTVYVREQCGLCEELLAELAPLVQQHGLSLRVVDLDHEADPVRQRRYTLKVPVVEWDGSLICHGRLDRAELERLLAKRPVPGPSR